MVSLSLSLGLLLVVLLPATARPMNVIAATKAYHNQPRWQRTTEKPVVSTTQAPATPAAEALKADKEVTTAPLMEAIDVEEEEVVVATKRRDLSLIETAMDNNEKLPASIDNKGTEVGVYDGEVNDKNAEEKDAENDEVADYPVSLRFILSI